MIFTDVCTTNAPDMKVHETAVAKHNCPAITVRVLMESAFGQILTKRAIIPIGAAQIAEKKFPSAFAKSLPLLFGCGFKSWQ